jgi:superfamily I DNA/RNA helicase
MRTRVFGPPGTGKTTYLIKLIRAFLDGGGDLRDVCFLSFSRNAVAEITERLQKELPRIPHTHYVWFRTIHSMSYCLAGVKQGTSELMTAKRLMDFLKKAKYIDDYRPYADVKQEIDSYQTLITFLRRRLVAEDSFEESRLLLQRGVDTLGLKTFRTLYNVFKKHMKYVDFTDVLEQAVNVARVPHRFKLLLVDEAQDLCTLQWQIVERLCGVSENVYLAGDDDQSIYRFSGASLDGFLDFPVDQEVQLEQSYRIPAAVHTLSQIVIKRVSRRKEKVFHPRSEGGDVYFVGDAIEAVRENEGKSILLLTLANMEGAEYFRILGELQIACTYDPLGFNETFFKRLDAVVAFRRGDTRKLSYSSARWLLELSSESKPWLTTLETMPRCAISHDEEMGELIRKVKMSRFMIAKNEWDAVKIKVEEWMFEAWLHNYLERGTTQPIIKISTPYREKGSEADCVIMDLSYGQGVADQLEYDADSLHRAIYVGMTRAKYKLYLIQGNTSGSRSYSIHYGVA